MGRENKGSEKPKKSRKKLVWMIIAGVLLVLLIGGGIEAYRILYKPQDLFNMATIDPALFGTPKGTPLPTPEPEGTDASANPSTEAPTDEPTPSPTPCITQAKDILNVMLIGIDRNPEGGKSAGSDPHSDVMMVLAINFKENKVDLISLPRDTFIHAPDIMNGVYKLNASFNVGGGYKAKNGEAYQKVCQAAKYMLGGIPVDYYYAVDFEALMGLVNTIGGVDYDVESSAYSLQGKSGMQHMSGKDVLFYLRVRKVGPEQGDKNRVNRQKKMMIAIFNQLKKNGKLTMLPDIINSASSNVYTNTNLEQTLALAKFAASINPDKIGMHSMEGTMLNKAGWAYCFTDQKARKELIRQVYGIDVPEQVHCSSRYADWLLDNGFSGIRYLKTGKQMLDYADAHQTEFTAEQKTEYDALKKSYADTQAAYDRASLTFGSTDNHKLADAKKKMRDDVEKLAKLVGYKEDLKWTYSDNYWSDPGINQVLVDFR